MPADPAHVATLRAAAAQSNGDENSLSALTSIAEIAAFLVECDRAEGRDECFGAELVLTAACLSRQSLVEAASILRRLGYTSVAEMISQLARKTKRRPKPSRPGRARPH